VLFAEDVVPSLIETLSACFREVQFVTMALLSSRLALNDLVFVSYASQVGDSEHAWQTRECGLLALGCVADGCGAFMVEHFDQLLPYLLSQVQDRRVRECDL
jgi:hypothetical protein